MHGKGRRLLHRKHTRTTCLSSERHNDIKDHLSHYMGCLEYSEREFFFEHNEIWQSETRYLVEDHGRSQQEAEKRCREKRLKWKENCDREISRVNKLRYHLSKDDSEKHLVDCIKESSSAWKDLDFVQEHIKLIELWRKTELEKENDSKTERPRRLSFHRSQPQIVYNDSEEPPRPRRTKSASDEPPMAFIPEGPYNPAAFVPPVLARTPSAALSTISLLNSPTIEDPTVEDKDKGEYDPERDINVHMLQFKDGESHNIDEDPSVKGKFPDQKVKVLRILKEDDGLEASLLHKERFRDKITYFHFPANNMEWAEKAIARYFGQKRPEFHALERELRKQITETALILRESHWRGQLHGERTSPNSLFMRPLCEAISSDIKNASQGPNNVILFMPYLHWETTRQRQRFAEEIDTIISHQTATAVKKEIDDRNARKNERERLTDFIAKNKKTSPQSSQPSLSTYEEAAGAGCMPRFFKERVKTESEQQDPEAKVAPTRHQNRKIRTMPELLEKVQRSKNSLEVDDNGRPKAKTELGQYLLDAARLFEGMSNYRDKKLLEKYLDHDPPIHPRRTLDQAYYWSMNTRAKDTDQVVYRATTPKPGSFEHFDPEKRDDSQKKQWRGHPMPKKGDEGYECKTCRENIRMVSRVVMVDQLWMWILDEQTIITCFPKRYGSNKNDRSGIHKSIRIKFEGERGGQVKSVFDMALIIFDECSNSLFDRTKVTDNQPEVIESFSEAIGNIMHKQNVAFGKLWRWAERAREEIFLSSSSGNSKLNIPILDINPEGDMEREIRDIIEEIGIMLYIQKIHRDILKQFKTKATAIMTARVTSEKAAQDRKQDPNEQVSTGSRHDRADTASEAYCWFSKNAEELTRKVEDRVEQLEELQRNAERAATSVKDLLELKQQQASVVQAWQSVKQSEEAVIQGRSIVVFTVFTIIFLPLSFMTSIFGMNTFDLEANKISLMTALKYIFTISIGVVIVAIFLSLNDWVRMAMWCGWKQFITPIWMRSGIYEAYLHLNIGAPQMYHKTSRHLDELKRDANTKFLQRVKKWADRRAKLKNKGKTPTWWRIFFFRYIYATAAENGGDAVARVPSIGEAAGATGVYVNNGAGNVAGAGARGPGHNEAVGTTGAEADAAGRTVEALRASLKISIPRGRFPPSINGRADRRGVDEETGCSKGWG